MNIFYLPPTKMAQINYILLSMPKNAFSTIHSICDTIEGCVPALNILDPVDWTDFDQIGSAISISDNGSKWADAHSILLVYLDPYERFCKGVTEHIWQNANSVFPGDPIRIQQFPNLYKGLIAQANDELCNISPYNNSGGPSHYAPWINHVEKLYISVTQNIAPNLGIHLVEIDSTNHSKLPKWFAHHYNLPTDVADIQSGNKSNDHKKHLYNLVIGHLRANPKLDRSIRNGLNVEYLAIDNLANFPAVGSPFSSS